jgi:N-acetylmuramoyl-L-alanine amidase
MEMVKETYGKVLAALCLWREARGESREAKRGVLHVILNRSKATGKSLAKVILQRLQFSSFNSNDPNAVKWPGEDDPAWLECCGLVDTPGVDPTGGANHYESCKDDAEPSWADDARLTTRIGAFEFYRL